jgi:hypothetical protein
MLPYLHFCSPKHLPNPNSLQGRIVVLDIAFSAKGLKPSYEEMTGPFINELDARLAAWIDHHDHDYHKNFDNDPRFFLATKAEHPACPEMITPEIVNNAGPIDTILCHSDLDGLFSATKWILGGVEPYKGADKDAAAVDSRKGTIGEPARTIDFALRARFRDDQLKRSIIHHLISLKNGSKSFHWDEIKETAKLYEALAAKSLELSNQYIIENNIAFIKIPKHTDFDKTELLLLGQKMAKVSMIEYSGNITMAAPFDSGINFIELFDLGGGMPTRITISAKNKSMIFETLKQHLN